MKKQEIPDYASLALEARKNLKDISYDGKYTVELFPGHSEKFPKSITIQNDKITILHGEFIRGKDQLYFKTVEGKEFAADFEWVIRVLDEDEGVLWRNEALLGLL